jgi:hypothetical protein
MRTRHIVAVLVSLAVVGSGLAVAEGASGPGTSRLQIDSVGCTETAALGSRHVQGSCTYVFTDGRRFRCPLSFSNHRQTPGAIERASACEPLTPIRIPPAWQRVFTRLYSVQACLARHGIAAHGGPYLDGPRPRKTPIGELVSFNTSPTAFIAFYTSARVARRAEPLVIMNVQRTGGEAERRGLVTVAWTKPPSPSLRAAIDGCAF